MARKQRLSHVEQFHAWFDALPESVLLVSGDGEILAANPSLLRLIGPKSVLGHSLAEITAPPQDAIHQYLGACSASADPVEGSLLLQDAEGGLVSCRSEGTVLEAFSKPDEPAILLRLYPTTSASPKQTAEAAPASYPSPLEVRLRRGEERLRLVLEAGQMALWEWNCESNEVVGSPGLKGIRGKGFDPFRGSLEDYLNGIHSEDRQRVGDAIHEAIEKGSKYQAEYRVILPNLMFRWLEDRGTPVYDELGRPTGMVCVTLLIDDRKRLEQQLQSRLDRLANTEAQVRSVIETAVDGIVTIDEKATILTVNPAAERIFGYTAEELVGKSLGTLMPEPYRSQHGRYIANYLRTGHAKIIGTQRELIGRRKDGAVFPMELGVSEARLGGHRYFTGIVRDISERKREENVAHFLADASRSLATLVDYASTLQQVAYLAVPFFADWCTVHIGHDDGSLRQLAAAHIDPEKSIVAQELGNGYPLALESPLGPPRVFTSGKSELREDIPDSLVSGLAEDEQHREILRNLGLTSYIGVPLTVRRKVFGVISFFSADPKRKYDLIDLGMAEDLAHRASIAVENALLYGELRDVDRRKDEFLALLAHQLHTSLAPIQTGLDRLRLQGADPDSAQIMQHQVEQQLRLLDDLRDVSRILQGRVELRRERVAIQTPIDRAVEAVRPAIDAAQQNLEVSLPVSPVHVHADPARLTQVFIHLLSNAQRHTAPGGHIGISVRPDAESVTISVKDDGCGICEDLLPHVFDLFTRPHPSLERNRSGLGIGLTLVRSLVELHDGQVGAASEGEGKGSEFTVRLPLPKAEAHEKAPEAPPSAAKGRRILVVEDNVGTAKLLSRLLAKLGSHEIQIVHDGLSALEAAKKQQPEIVLLDIGLPRMNGYEVAKRLRQEPEFQATVLVALTGYGTEEDRRRSAAVGFDRHIVKPPSLDHLRQVLAHPRLASS